MTSPSLELWGGIECTRNRISDRWFDQVSRTGHDRRPGDLALIAELGIHTLRYPVLWEWAAPDDPSRFDWTWPDRQLPILKRLNIRPIVGLVHHGSGPRYTELLDPEFPSGLAQYAQALAARFPWVSDFTPINEPLTTARFSGLYGLWHPHLRDDRAFARAMLNQCRAVVLAMRAVRSVTPDARLIQTEDLGTVFSKPSLQYQADFENARRWLTFDLLTGRLSRAHPFGEYLMWLGFDERELLWFQENTCPPAIVGINYYVTSERYLDDDCELYSTHSRGSNGHHTYVDVEAVRVRPQGLEGAASILQEAWQRYRLPLAITEAHLGCRREEQIRWLGEIWRQAHQARSSGANVRAVTVWSLLGAYDWDSLVTQPRGNYESGVFHVKSDPPRPTGLARIVRQLAKGAEPSHPVLEQPGWWRRASRLLGAAQAKPSNIEGQPVLIAGGTGTLATAFSNVCQRRYLAHTQLGRTEFDIADAASVAAALQAYRPWAVINAAGYVAVDDAEDNRDRCWRENVAGPATLALACHDADIPLLTFSTDLVFDGQRRRPYCEEDAVNPLGAYGQSKLESERQVLSIYPGALIVRTSAFFGPWDEHNFVSRIRSELAAGRTPCVLNTVISPTYVPDLAGECLDLLLDEATGIWHLSNQGEIAWSELGKAVAVRSGFDPDLVVVRSAQRLGLRAPRPAYSALASRRGLQLPPWEDALERYFRESSLTKRMPHKCGQRD